MLIIGLDKNKNGLKDLEGSRHMTTDYKSVSDVPHRVKS
jgi:hypothetical protein